MVTPGIVARRVKSESVPVCVMVVPDSENPAKDKSGVKNSDTPSTTLIHIKTVPPLKLTSRY